jgi:hypothetical protein
MNRRELLRNTGLAAAMAQTMGPSQTARAAANDRSAQYQVHVRHFIDCAKSRKRPVAEIEDGTTPTLPYVWATSPTG